MTLRAPSDRPPPTVGIYSGLDLIGDGLFKLPMLRAARAAFPSHRIVYVTSGPTLLETRLRPLLDGIVDEFISNTGIAASPLELVQPLPTPLRRRFSVVIDTQPVLWRTLLLRRIPHDLFVTGAANYRLSDRRPSDRRRRPVSIVRRLVVLVELASGRPADLITALPVPSDVRARAEAALPAGPVYIGLAPGAGGRQKCWPLSEFTELAGTIAAAGQVPVFLLGPAETGWADEISAAVPTARFPLQDRALWGDDYDPIHTVALGHRLAAAVANDSGTNHMLAAADTALLTLFGPTNAEKFRPLVRRGSILRAQDFGSETMAAIPVDAVRTALTGLLAGPA